MVKVGTSVEAGKKKNNNMKTKKHERDSLLKTAYIKSK